MTCSSAACLRVAAADGVFAAEVVRVARAAPSECGPALS